MLTLREFIDYCNDELVVITEYGDPTVLFDGYVEDAPRYLYNDYVTHVCATCFENEEPKLHILLGGN